MKYKLIKEYPGSPKLGTIVYLETKDNYMTNMENDFKLFPKKIVENYPEFWKKVIEKDYKILSFKSNEGNIVDLSYFTCEEDFIGNSIWKINSVKRKDGEIFTIGDRIQYYNITGEKSHTHVISDITIYENKILLNHNHGTWKSHGDFNKVQKFKQKLFITNDGVDVFNLDKVFYINGWSDDDILDVLATTASKFTQNKYFSTKEKAEEYVNYEKPYLNNRKVVEILNNSKNIKDAIKIFTKKLAE